MRHRYGLGMIFYKQEKYDQAEYHFKRALAINAASPVLQCHVAMAMHAQRKSPQALAILNKVRCKACLPLLDDRGQTLETHFTLPLLLFNKAMVLFGIGRNDEALKELLCLKDMVPRESSVYFLLGKVYQKV